MVFPGTSFVLGTSDIHQRSNISSMRSFESRWGSPQGRISHTNAESSFIYRSLKNDSQAAAIIQTLIKTRCPLHCDGVMLAITGLYDRDHAEHAPEELTHHAIAAGHSQYAPRPCSTVQRAPSSSSGMKTAPRAASSCRTWLRPSQAPTGRHRRPCPTAARPGKEPPDKYKLPHFKKHNEPYINGRKVYKRLFIRCRP